MLQSRNTIKFYQSSKSNGLEDLLDFLLKRYPNIEYLMNMEADQGIVLIRKAFENYEKEQLYLKWLHDPSRFELSFEEYVKSHQPYRKSTDKEKEEILRKYGGDCSGIV